MTARGKARFSPRRRIRKRSEFQRVQRAPEARAHARHLVVLAARPVDPEAVASEARLGLVVSKKVGSAVIRNRVKRRLREIFRRARWPIADLVVIVRPEAAAANAEDLRHDLRRCASQVARKLGLAGTRSNDQVVRAASTAVHRTRPRTDRS